MRLYKNTTQLKRDLRAGEKENSTCVFPASLYRCLLSHLNRQFHSTRTIWHILPLQIVVDEYTATILWLCDVCGAVCISETQAVAPLHLARVSDSELCYSSCDTFNVR